MKRRFAILSGRGSNMAALSRPRRGGFSCDIAVWLPTARTRAGWKERARPSSRPVVIKAKPFGKERAGSSGVAVGNGAAPVELIAWPASCGYYRVASSSAGYGKMLNIHPS